MCNVIKWTNKFSGETGFVKELDKVNKCFHNTSDIHQAKCYNVASNARRAIRTLAGYGEAVNNAFELIEM